MANAVISMELQDEQEQWLNFFKHWYLDSVTIEDIQKLEQSFVISIYMHFVKYSLNANMENMSMIGLNAHGHMNAYPELYENSMLLPRVYKLLCWFFRSFYGDHTFTFNDLITPKPAKSRTLLRYIIDFVYNYQYLTDKFDDIKKEVDMCKQSIKECEDERDGIIAAIQSAEMQKAEEAIQMEEEMKRCAVLRDEIDKKQHTKAPLVADCEAVRQKIADCRTRLDCANLLYVELEEEEKVLRSSLVTAEQLAAVGDREQQIQQMQQDVQDIKEQLTATEGTLATKEASRQLWANHILPLVEAHKLQEAELVEVRKASTDLRKRKGRSSTLLEEQDHQLSVLHQRADKLCETERQIVATSNKKKQALLADLKSTTEELGQLNNNKKEVEEADQCLNIELQQCQRQFEELDLFSQTMENEFAASYHEATQAMEAHNLKNEKALAALAEACN